MNYKKAIALFLIVCMLIANTETYSASAAPTEIDKLKQQQELLNKQIQETQQKKNLLQKQKKTVSQQIEELDNKLDKAENDLGKVEDSLVILDNQIAITVRELDRASSNADSQKQLLKKRVRAIYENGSVGYLSVLLDSDSFADLISRLDFLKMIINYDVNLLRTMKHYKDTIAEKRQQLLTEQTAKEKLKADITAKKTIVEVAAKDKQKALASLTSNLKDLEKLEDKLLEQSAEIAKKIVSLQSKNKYIGGKFTWPAPGYYKITSEYGYRVHPILKKKKLHTGIDISVPKGADVVAANSGTVIYSGYYGGYGNTVIIDHGGKISSLYAHNSKLLVKEGDRVAKGQVISKCGSTGLSTGPHVHFEVRVNGETTDPMAYFK